MFKLRWLVTCIALPLGSAHLAAQADTLTLKNGDRLSGTVLSKEGTTVLLRTKYAGDVQVQWTELAGITTDQPVHLILNDESSLNGTLLPTDAGRIRIKAGEIVETAPFDLAQLRFINPSAEVSGQGVKVSGRINVGVAASSGNTDTQNAHFDGEWIARARNNRFTAGADFNQTRNNNQETASNGRGYLQYDHFMNKNWYVYANASAEHDRLADLDLRSALGGGSGYQIFEGNDRNLSVEGGLNYVSEAYGQAPAQSYPSARWGLKYDQMLFGGPTQLFHEQGVLLGLEQKRNIIAKTKTGLRFPFSKMLVGSAQLNLDWTREPPAGKQSTDRTFLFTLGYQW